MQSAEAHKVCGKTNPGALPLVMTEYCYVACSYKPSELPKAINSAIQDISTKIGDLSTAKLVSQYLPPVNGATTLVAHLCMSHLSGYV